MVAPAADQVSKEFDITSSVLKSMVFSVFVLGYGKGLCVCFFLDLLTSTIKWVAVGPLVLGPLR